MHKHHHVNTALTYFCARAPHAARAHITTRATALAPCPSAPLVPHDMRGRGARRNPQFVRTGAHINIMIASHFSAGKPGRVMARPLGNAEPPKHHLIMGVPASNGPGNRLSMFDDSPAAHALPGCIQNHWCGWAGQRAQRPREQTLVKKSRKCCALPPTPHNGCAQSPSRTHNAHILVCPRVACHAGTHYDARHRPRPYVPRDPWSPTTCESEARVTIHNSCALAHTSIS